MQNTGRSHAIIRAQYFSTSCKPINWTCQSQQAAQSYLPTPWREWGGTAKGSGADLGSDKGRCHILHLQHCQAGQLLVDALENVVVQVPGLMQLRLLAAAPVLVAPLIRFRQLMAVCLKQARHDW